MGSVGLPIFHGDVKIVKKTGQEVRKDEVGEIPRYVEFVKGLPKTPSGKILKNLLKTGNFGSENSQPSPKCRDKQQTSP
jgi:acyl-coenzyme A synthetase/AMP-(fatty) acid ligase